MTDTVIGCINIISSGLCNNPIMWVLCYTCSNGGLPSNESKVALLVSCRIGLSTQQCLTECLSSLYPVYFSVWYLKMSCTLKLVGPFQGTMR